MPAYFPGRLSDLFVWPVRVACSCALFVCSVRVLGSTGRPLIDRAFIRPLVAVLTLWLLTSEIWRALGKECRNTFLEVFGLAGGRLEVALEI